MFAAATVKDVQAKGRQKPERFVGGERDVLANNMSKSVGLGFTATQTNEQAFEIHAGRLARRRS
jgi:hypothetical protein